MIETLSSILYFIVVIAILVVVHEWGHYIAARLCKTRCDIFAVGMGRRIFGWNRKTGFTFGPLAGDFAFDGQTDWRVCLLPIGGYVKIVGMIDESFDSNYVASKPKPWEFRSKNALQKAFILSNGVLMNLLLAIAIFSYISYDYGKLISKTTSVSYVHPNSPASLANIQSGDELISVNGEEMSDWESLMMSLSIDNIGQEIVVELIRDGRVITANLNSDEIISLMSEGSAQKSLSQIIGIDPAPMRTVLTEVLTLKPAGRIGLRSGDTIISIDGEMVHSPNQFRNIIRSKTATSFLLSWKRGDRVMNSFISPDPDSTIGVMPSAAYLGVTEHTNFTLSESLSNGYSQSLAIIGLIYNYIREIIVGEMTASQAFGGPITIAKQSAQSANRGIKSFLTFVASLSISLALINIFPLPALDGGHLLIVLIESVRRKELAIKTKLLIQNIGAGFIFLLMIIIIFFDGVKYFG